MMKSFFAFLLITISLMAQAIPPETQLNFKSGVFSHFTSQDLHQKNDLIEKAIITIHGSERNAHTYYNSIETLARRRGESHKILIVSPHYKEVQDAREGNEFYFYPEGWLSGDEAINRKDVNAFEIVDHMVALMADKSKFPNLKEIVITGHSAGGQLVQRFAVGSVLDQSYPAISFRYVVANPGSYLYLTNQRPFRGPKNCAFNNYKFGMDKRNAYMSQRPAANMISDYLKKDVVYFLGEADIRSDDIDQTCPAVYQGHFRLERGQAYMQQLNSEFPQHQHHIYTVPGVGHTQYGMYTSENGIQVLFQKI
jgi:uncharacterized alpha/beta hydrolase family protein